MAKFKGRSYKKMSKDKEQDSKINKIIKTLAPELKRYHLGYLEINPTAVNYTGTSQFYNPFELITQGTQSYQRIGTQINVKYIKFRFHYTPSSNASDPVNETIKIGWYTGIKNSAISSGALDATSAGITAYENEDVVRTLKQQIIFAQKDTGYNGGLIQSQSKVRTFNLRFPKGHKIQYQTSSNTPVNGSIYLATRPDTPIAFGTPLIVAAFEIGYYDV